MSGSSLRPHPVQRSLHSPTNSSSDHTTTPTSPYFSTYPNGPPPVPRAHPHPYANRSVDLLASTSTLASTSRSPSHRAATPPLLHPPAGVSFSRYLEGWTGEQVHQFLTLHKCGHYYDTFLRNDIDGRVLLDLDMASLKEMGVVKVGERVKLLSGIKDLRKRVAGNVSAVAGMGRSVVELRLNGTATPSPDWTNGAGFATSNGAASGMGVSGVGAGGHGLVRNGHERSLSHAGSQSSMGDRRGMVDRSLSARRAGTSRPPPLDLQSSSRGHAPSLSYSHPGGNGTTTVPVSAVSAASTYDVPVSASTQRATTPRPTTQGQPYPGSLQRPSISSQTSSSATITPAVLHSSSNSRSQTHASNMNLRAPPPRDTGRRSPSPSNDPANFMDRPLPPPPAAASSSSAAEYARQHAGTPTPMPNYQSGNNKGPSPSVSDRRLGSGHNQPSVSALRDAAVIRKNPSASGTLGSAPQKQASPVKSKFSAITGGSRQPQMAVHPFAATRDLKEISPPKEREQSHRSGEHHSGPHRSQTGGYPIAPGPHSSGFASSGGVPSPMPARQNSASSASATSGGGVHTLVDLRKKLVKFINSEDGTSRTVNVTNCVSGVEVLELVLKKFGKWNTGNVNTDTESDEEGERLEVDGWGVYREDSASSSKPLSEASLLRICLSQHDDLSQKQLGLVLRRSRKFGNRKNMTDFFGEQPPPPLSPTSPTYFGGPRLGITQAQSPSALLITPTRTKRAGSANTNRASMVSVMSGLGVALADPPSPSAPTRSPGSGSFLPASRKKMYNFFGHRPASELISNHLADYFPSAKKKELEKTVRKSVHRQSIYGAKRGSIAPSVMSGRDSFDFAPSARPSPPRRRPTSRMTMTSPPSASAIPEEGEGADEGGDIERLQSGRPGVPRMSVSDDTGSIRRPTIDGDTSASSGGDSDRPPLLPAFEAFNESLSDSLQAYSRSTSGESTAASANTSPARPKSIALKNRRNSASSARSRMSTLSQLRRNRDKSDTASMLTVDEITAEVENRRASTISFDETSDEEENEPAVVGTAILAPPQAISMSADVPVDEGESGEADDSEDDSDEEDSSDEDEEDSDDEDEVDAGEDEHGKAYTSTGSGRIIKWIKGALIGAGSFGSVYLGMDAQSGLLMAVKQVELGSGKNVERKRGMIEALEREIELLKELQHENIVQYLDSSTDGTHLNIFLEYVPGGSITALLNNYGRFEEELVRTFVRQILTGLNYLHEREIIHRDIKGANILVDNKGGIKISDFGISKKVESNLLQGIGASRPSLQGSVFWMAPEIVKQTSYTSSADIWSVGCLVVEMLTGTHPWSDLTQMQALFRIGQAICPAIPSDISPQAADLLKSTFEIDHTKRPTALELLKYDFLTVPPETVFVSEAEAQASMAAVHAGAQRGMAMMGTKA